MIFYQLYPGIKHNKPLSVAIAFGRNPNDILAWEYKGNGQWQSKIIDSFELEQRAYILISPMVEFPDGSNLFINPSEGVGKCAKSNIHPQHVTCVVSGNDCKCQYATNLTDIY